MTAKMPPSPDNVPQEKDVVLIVDDTVESVRFLIDTIESTGMTALVATSAEKAFTLLERVVPNVILMDAVMPVMDGFEATRQIKANSDWAHIPIIFMTGLSEPQHVVAALDAGGVDYVRKPLVVEELLARLSVHLANARALYHGKTALDVSRRRLIIINPSGHLAWTTPQAEDLLESLQEGWGFTENGPAPECLIGPLQRLLSGDYEEGGALKVVLGSQVITLTRVGTTGNNQTFVRLEEVSEELDVERLRTRHNLTQREAEVLLWISYGKTNRGISDILNISPRTVNKHLEQVFEKLGVETRAAAAAAAVRTTLE
ncbi:MAG: response regulator [Pseudomonadota bacterium]